MPQALLPLLINTMIGAMFVASFLTIAYFNPSEAKLRYMAVSYGLGLLQPVSALAIVFGVPPGPMQALGYGAFLTALASMSPALSLFYRKRPMWRAVASIIVFGCIYRWVTWDAARAHFWYELGFQTGFALGGFLCAFTVWKQSSRTGPDHLLAAIFTVVGFHFLLKPAVASYFGTGMTEREYANSLYAVISQASTGVLLIAAGLLILINVLQSIVRSHWLQARIDPLTGLPNRRELFETFDAHMKGRKADGKSSSIAVIDIDHFKGINDRHGHESGDRILQAIASCLQQNRPATASVARIGGEEFVVFLPGEDEPIAKATCESLRMAVSDTKADGLPTITISVGLTTVRSSEDMADALRRADQALYEAKNSGRNRCVVWSGPRSGGPNLTLVKP